MSACHETLENEGERLQKLPPLRARGGQGDTQETLAVHSPLNNTQDPRFLLFLKYILFTFSF